MKTLGNSEAVAVRIFGGIKALKTTPFGMSDPEVTSTWLSS